MLTNATLLAQHGEMRRRHGGERLHLQISLDGLRESHDRIRGRGQFDRLCRSFDWLRAEGIPFIGSMCVPRANVRQMPDVEALTGEKGDGNVDFLWYFVAGRAEAADWAETEEVFAHLRQAGDVAAQAGIGRAGVRIHPPPRRKRPRGLAECVK